MRFPGGSGDKARADSAARGCVGASGGVGPAGEGTGRPTREYLRAGCGAAAAASAGSDCDAGSVRCVRGIGGRPGGGGFAFSGELTAAAGQFYATEPA